MSWGEIWGTTDEERRLLFPCDGMIERPDAQLFRGVTVEAAPAVVFRWLCQMRAAPYSYDWIDNGGRQSPRQLTPGLDELEFGQSVMTIFTLAAFERDRHLTIRIKRPSPAASLFGDIAGSYVVVPQTPHRCRLLVKLVCRYPAGVIGVLMRALLPSGDLVMMRRQLLNLKGLAEETERGAVRASS